MVSCAYGMLLVVTLVCGAVEPKPDLWMQFRGMARRDRSAAWQFYRGLSESQKLRCTLDMVKANDPPVNEGPYLTFLEMMRVYTLECDGGGDAVLAVYDDKETPASWKEMLFSIADESIGELRLVPDRRGLVRDRAAACVGNTEVGMRVRRTAVLHATKETLLRIGHTLHAAAGGANMAEQAKSSLERALEVEGFPGREKLKAEVAVLVQLREHLVNIIKEEDVGARVLVYTIAKALGDVNLVETTETGKQLAALADDAKASTEVRVKAALCAERIAPGSLKAETKQWLETGAGDTMKHRIQLGSAPPARPWSDALKPQAQPPRQRPAASQPTSTQPAPAQTKP